MRRLPFLLLLLFFAAPAMAAPAASEREIVAGLVRDVMAALNRKDRETIARLTWPDGHYAVTRVPRREPPEWVDMGWSEIGFPRDISYRSTISNLAVEVDGDRANATARVVGLCYRGETFTGVRLVSDNVIEAERRGREWRIRDWWRDVRREGSGPC